MTLNIRFGPLVFTIDISPSAALALGNLSSALAALHDDDSATLDKLDSITKTQDQITSTLTSQDSTMADIKQELRDLKGDVGTLHTAVTGAAGKIGDLTSSVKDLNDKLAQNPSDDPEVQQLVTDMHTDLQAMGAELAAAGQAVTPPTDTGTTGDTGTAPLDAGNAPADQGGNAPANP